MPCARLRAGIAVPAVPPRFKDILEVKGCVLRPDSPRNGTSAVQETAETCNARSGQPHCQQLDRSKTVVHCAVTVVEEACGLSEIGEFRALEPLRCPIDLAERAGPWFGREYLAESFKETAVERRVVRDDE